MSLSHIETIEPTAAVAFVDDRIIEIVTERPGIKETDLALDIMMDLTDRASGQDPIADDIDTASIFDEINRMITSGRIDAIDCAIGDHDYTFLVPAAAKTSVRGQYRH
jgi:hypothetical protein